MFDEFDADEYGMDATDDFNAWEEEQVFQDREGLDEDDEPDEWDVLDDYERDHGEISHPDCPECREYEKGKAEASRYLEDVRTYGRELADAWEMERELRDPDPYY